MACSTYTALVSSHRILVKSKIDLVFQSDVGAVAVA
jgi:hypothetical protein